MARSINFVQTRQKELSQASKKDAKIRIVSTIILVCVFFLFLVTVGLRFLTQQMVEALEERKEAATREIVNQEGTERDYTLFIYKLQTLTKLFDDRKDKQQAISYFNSVFGTDVLVREIKYSAENQKVSFTLQAKDIFTLEEVYATFSSEEFAQTYPVVQKTGLRRELGGSYVMDISVLLDTVVKK